MINPELELRLETDLEALVVRWVVPEPLSYLEGHFPGFPVLPGVATIDVTLEAIRRVLGVPSVRLKKLQGAKFKQPICPGQKIEIQLASLPPDSSTQTVQWKAQWKVISGSAESTLVAELNLVLNLDLGLDLGG